MSSPPEQPTAGAVREKLIDMLADRISREAAANWAERWVMSGEPVVDDRDVWRALKRLAAADSKVSPSEFLFSESDFHQWLDDLEIGTESKD